MTKNKLFEVIDVFLFDSVGDIIVIKAHRHLNGLEAALEEAGDKLYGVVMGSPEADPPLLEDLPSPVARLDEELDKLNELLNKFREQLELVEDLYFEVDELLQAEREQDEQSGCDV